MDRRDAARRMREIAEVRALQQAAAEAEAVRAAAGAREAKSRRDDGASRLSDEQDGWAASMDGHRFDPGVARAWSSGVRRREDELRELEGALGTASGEEERKASAWHAARARSEAAEEEAKRSARAASRWREEASLTEIADRAARKARP
jgi:hypothetical protein